MNRVDFLGVISVDGANPNGDPIDLNIPRTDIDGHGIMSDVCLKRKVRDRLEADGYPLFCTASRRDGHVSMLARISKTPETAAAWKANDLDALSAAACAKWIDVRAFGQVLNVLRQKKKKAEDDSESGGTLTQGVRGAVTIGEAVSIDITIPRAEWFTRKASQVEDDPTVPESSSMGKRWFVDRAAYVFKGGIYPQLAETNGLTPEDVEAIKSAILRMMDGDASASRPVGSMTLSRLWWWEHDSKTGQYSPAKVFRTLTFEPAAEYPFYKVVETPLPGLTPEVLEGW